MPADVDISVIVPARDVEPYVGELLDDLTAQHLTSFEVILVDDGSTDATPRILQRACEADPRFRFFETRGVGPGAARNAGIERAVGHYLTFIDSDDRVSENHLSWLHTAAQKHQVPFVVIAGERFFKERRFTSAVYRRPFAPPVPETSHITRRHALLYDTTMHNKLIERSFWIDAVGAFPEGVWHEDLRPSIQLHLATPEVALVNERSYYWRVRSEGGPSITQSRGSLFALEGRIRGLEEIHHLLEAYGDADLSVAFLERVLGFDLALQLKHAGDAPDGYIEKLRKVVAHYLDLAPDGTLDALSLNKRAGYTLLLAGHDAAVRGLSPRLLKKRAAFGVQPYRTLTRRVRLRAVPFESDGFSRSAQRTLDSVRVDASDAGAWATLTSVGVDPDGLRLTGDFGLTRLSSTTTWLDTTVVAVVRRGTKMIEAPTDLRLANDEAGQAPDTAEGVHGTFEAVLPTKDLLSLSATKPILDIHVDITLAPSYVARCRVRVSEDIQEGLQHVQVDPQAGDRPSAYPYATKRKNLSIKIRAPRRPEDDDRGMASPADDVALTEPRELD